MGEGEAGHSYSTLLFLRSKARLEILSVNLDLNQESFMGTSQDVRKRDVEIGKRAREKRKHGNYRSRQPAVGLPESSPCFLRPGPLSRS